MRLEFSKQQAELLYELIAKSQILGSGAKMIAEIQSVIEKAVEDEKKPKEKKQL